MTRDRGPGMLERLAQALGLRSAPTLDLTLQQNEAWSRRSHGSTLEVRCLSGALWVTRQGDPDDHILMPGDALETSRRGRLAMVALRPARIWIGPAASLQGGSDGKQAAAVAGEGDGRGRYALSAAHGDAGAARAHFDRTRI